MATSNYPPLQPRRCYDILTEKHTFFKNAAHYQTCHCEERSDVAISSNALKVCGKLINIENLKYTMLIGTERIEAPVLEIPTALRASE